MTDLHDAFDQLDPHRPPRGAAPVLAAAQARAGTTRLRRRLAIGLGTASAVALVAVGVGTIRSDGGRTVETDPGPLATNPTATSTTDPSDTTGAEGAAGHVTVDVYLSPADGEEVCSETVAVSRSVQGPAVLFGALEALLAGPTSEELDDGLASFFSDDTAGALRSVEIVDGTALIDFTDFTGNIPNASTSCGSSILLRQLDRTALQFPTVERTLYSFNGDVDAFYYWLQGTPPDYYSPSLTGWTESVEVDVETGEVQAHGFNELIEAEQPTWAQDPRSVTTVLLHLDERKEGELLDLRQEADPGGRIVMAAEIRVADDSVAAVRYVIVFGYDADGLLRFESGVWSQRCQAGRGHQDYQLDPCV